MSNLAWPCLRGLLAATLVASLAAYAPAHAQEAEPGKGGMRSKLPGWLGGDQPEFFRMPPFSVPTIREAGVVGQISLMVTLEVVGLSNKTKVIQKRQHLQSGFLRDLYGVASINNGSGQALQLDTVKNRLNMVADRVLGAGVVKNVLVENAHTRPLD